MNLENIFEKAKDAFESAYKKTGDVVNIQKQKLDVTSLESKLAKSFEMLGKVCYDSIERGDTFDPETAKPITDDIAEKLVQIKDLRKEILKAKNKRICARCGATIDRNAAFCSTCGASTKAASSDASSDQTAE